MKRRDILRAISFTAAAQLPFARAQEKAENTIFLAPNMHADNVGWLGPYHVERNYCLYNYLDHQDRVLKDPNYKYIFSEITNAITMLEYEPQRFKEMQSLIQQGRVELVNAFIAEGTINLSGGEALVMHGVEGLRWYSQVMNASPRYAYMIDTTGWHEQMAQITKGLGLDAFIYVRYNPTSKIPEDAEYIRSGDPMHWIESPDGTRVLAINPGHYTGPLKNLMRAGRPQHDGILYGEIKSLIDMQRKRWARFPKDAPLFSFVGQADYSLAFNCPKYPSEMLKIWNAYRTGWTVRMSTIKDWFDLVKPEIAAGKYDLQVIKTGSKIYGWASFWVNAPKAKQWYRRSEHGLQAAEALATMGSLKTDFAYPSQEFSNAWFVMALNQGRGPLWGIAVSEVYEHPKCWDVVDRYNYVDKLAARVTAQAIPAVFGKEKDTIGLFNPSNFPREDLFELQLPAGKVVEDARCQVLEDGKTMLVATRLPSLGMRSFKLTNASAKGTEAKLAASFETKFYSAKLDPDTGALTSLRLKPSGRELLGGAANVVLAQVTDPRYFKDDLHFSAHNLLPRSQRKTVFSSAEGKSELRVQAGLLATIVTAEGPFRGGKLRRVMRFYPESPRIDFITETNDLQDLTIVTAEFPFAEDITDVRRGIPYGFSHGSWSSVAPERRGNHAGIVPVIRWSHYTLAGGAGVALLDRGVPGRELVDRTAVILMHNVNDHYYWDHNTNWMSGRGKIRFEYALLAHDTPWEQAGIPQMAWNYNAPPLLATDVKPNAEESFVETSGNVIVEALRRVGNEIEMRLVECNGAAGTARLKIMLPHSEAALTNMIGGERTPIARQGGEYRFPIRPQQIVTLRLKTAQAVAPIQALRSYDPVVPEHKRVFTRSFKHPELIGHTPEVDVSVWKALEK